MKIKDSKIFKQHGLGPRAVRMSKFTRVVGHVCATLMMISVVILTLAVSLRIWNHNPLVTTIVATMGVLLIVASLITWMFVNVRNDSLTNKVGGRVQELADRLGISIEGICICTTDQVEEIGRLKVVNLAIELRKLQEAPVPKTLAIRQADNDLRLLSSILAEFWLTDRNGLPDARRRARQNLTSSI